MLGSHQDRQLGFERSYLHNVTLDHQWRFLEAYAARIVLVSTRPTSIGAFDDAHGHLPLQFHAGFTFDDAAALCGYLSDLAVSRVYCSPYLQAAKGSTHGYDVIDHSQPNAELGGEGGLERFVGSLQTHGLGQVLDIVPNHMAISTSENRWWADVLENGPSSHFAGYFDLDWDPPETRLRNAVLIPVLGDHYGRALEAGELTVVRDGMRFSVPFTLNAHHETVSFTAPSHRFGRVWHSILETASNSDNGAVTSLRAPQSTSPVGRL